MRYRELVKEERRACSKVNLHMRTVEKRRRELKEDVTMKLVSKMRKKKNNKGFSLVELIVVVLIIAIIAVALAPQVMKWVGTARTNVDENNKATLKSAVQVAVAEYQAAKGSLTTSYTFEAKDISDASSGSLAGYIKDVLDGDYPTPKNGGVFKIVITAEGAVKIE